jgi:hypothetical protein
MAVMLNMTDLTDGWPLTQLKLFKFILYNQSVASSFSTNFLWHISCDVYFKQNMKSFRTFCKFELSVFPAGRIRGSGEENY